MKKIYLIALFAAPFFVNAQTNVGITGNVDGVYINEFHYDNTGTDAGEFVEVAGPAGTDLSTYTITLYNGSNNTSYMTINLTGVIDNEGAGVGAVSFAALNMQNGAPDAIALSKTGSTNIQYISYEGVMTAAATNGPAVGLNSVDIGVSETGLLSGTSLEYDEASSAWIIVSDDTPDTFAQGPVLGVHENSIAGLKIYPNPVSNGKLFISSDLNAEKSVSIYDVLGKQVVKTKIENETINVSNLNAGVYIVKITEDGKTATRKLVIK